MAISDLSPGDSPFQEFIIIWCNNQTNLQVSLYKPRFVNVCTMNLSNDKSFQRKNPINIVQNPSPVIVISVSFSYNIH